MVKILKRCLVFGKEKLLKSLFVHFNALAIDGAFSQYETQGSVNALYA